MSCCEHFLLTFLANVKRSFTGNAKNQHKRQATAVVNDQIQSDEVRLVAADGSMLGVVSTPKAIRLATEQGFDLVQVDPSGQPPVCRMMDYGATKFREQKKKRQSAAKPQAKLKQLRLTHRTEKQDVAMLIQKAREFLTRRHSVKFNVIFRGRDRNHFQRGTELLREIEVALKDLAKIDRTPKRESRLLSALFVPRQQESQQERTG